MNAKMFYFLSLLTLAISIFLFIEFPESNRLNMIAGMLIVVGFGLNIAAFFMQADKIKLKNKQLS